MTMYTDDFILVRCPAHSACECWIIRRWQEATQSYVFESSFEEHEDALIQLSKKLGK